jgi:DNA-binding HxlR family transcriptional regulator
MSSKPSYHQFCPLAMAAEFLCSRWTLLILRELLLGSSSFNDIGRGVTRMSRTLLSARLKELTERGIVTKEDVKSSAHAQYRLTPAGESLSSVVFGMAEWSQEWLEIEPALENLDADYLMWSVRQSAQPHPGLPNPFVVNFYLPDQAKAHQNSWLVFKGDEVELCIIDHGFDVDVQVEAITADLTKVFMGWSGLAEAIQQRKLILRGPKRYTNIFDQWFTRSRLANIEKQPKALRVC